MARIGHRVFPSVFPCIAQLCPHVCVMCSVGQFDLNGLGLGWPYLFAWECPALPSPPHLLPCFVGVIHCVPKL